MSRVDAATEVLVAEGPIVPDDAAIAQSDPRARAAKVNATALVPDGGSLDPAVIVETGGSERTESADPTEYWSSRISGSKSRRATCCSAEDVIGV